MQKNKIRKAIDKLIYFKDVIESIAFFGSPVVMYFSKAAIYPDINNQALLKIWNYIHGNTTIFSISTIILFALILKLLYTIHARFFHNTKWFTDFMSGFHEYYIHLMRDHVAELGEISSNISMMDMNKEKLLKEYVRIYNDEYKKLEGNIQLCVNQISELLNEIMGYDENEEAAICVCLKMVSVDSINRPLLDKSVITVARSSNTPENRKGNSVRALIKDNSDFLSLSEGFSNTFAYTNLRERYANGTYKNSSKRFSYESTIVVPIRYKKQEYSMEVKGNTIGLKKGKREKEKRKQLKFLLRMIRIY